MKFLCFALPLLGTLAVAQSLLKDDCQCPQVKCPASNTWEGCRCINLAEWTCRRRCPRRLPTKYKICLPPRPTTLPSLGIPTPALPTPALPTPALPTPVLPPSPELPDTPLIPGCECEEMMCIQSYPESCHCAYGIAKNCWAKCGGPSPGLNTCPPLGGNPLDLPVKRAAVPQSTVSPLAVVPAIVAPLASALAPIKKPCVCETVMCIQSYPAGCICANAGKHACWKKCGGPKPTFSSCTSPTKPPVSPSRKVQQCGGNRLGAYNCSKGYTCINDPYRSGCGLECDAPGICVKDKLCGGFAGFACEEKGQVCVDDPRDECSPQTGGADCGGLCVWPPALRT